MTLADGEMKGRELGVEGYLKIGGVNNPSFGIPIRESHLVDAGPGGQERLDDVGVPVLGGVVERSVAALVDEVDVLRPGQQLLHLVG